LNTNWAIKGWLASSVKRRLIWRRWQCSRDRNAADRLLRAEGGQVLSTALRYRHYGVPLSELVADGNLGVVGALGKFDPERGIRLATYAAYWIRACILEHVVKILEFGRGRLGRVALADVFHAASRASTRHRQAQAGARDAVERALAELDPRERFIAQHRLLADPGEEIVAR
jgi:RNA polymerase sigma factor (sigma-70 family)